MIHIVSLFAYLLLSGGLSALWLLLVWGVDRYEREPLHTLFLAVFWGAVPAVFVSCLFEWVLVQPLSILAGQGTADVLNAVLVAPLVEEALKALALLLVVFLFRREFDGILDGMVYGAAVGIGFSFVEDFAYFLSALMEGGAASGGIIFVLRNVGFVLNHSLFTALTGIGFGLARTFPRSPAARILFPLLGFTFAVGAHALHNGLAQLKLPGLFLAFTLHGAAGFLLLALVPFLWALERSWVMRELGEEVAEGRIPASSLGALPFSGRPAPPVPPGSRAALRAALVRLAFQRRQAEEWAREAGQALEPLRTAVRSICPGPAPAGGFPC